MRNTKRCAMPLLLLTVSLALASTTFSQTRGSMTLFGDVKVDESRAGGNKLGSLTIVLYTQGGAEPTVTDANLLLGRINPSYFLGGEMPLSLEQARKATGKLAAKLGMPVDEVARGIIRLANANMVNAIKLVSVRKGHDPREYVLVAFGGGGPMHASAAGTNRPQCASSAITAACRM